MTRPWEVGFHTPAGAQPPCHQRAGPRDAVLIPWDRHSRVNVIHATRVQKHLLGKPREDSRDGRFGPGRLLPRPLGEPREGGSLLPAPCRTAETGWGHASPRTLRRQRMKPAGSPGVGGGVAAAALRRVPTPYPPPPSDAPSSSSCPRPRFAPLPPGGPFLLCLGQARLLIPPGPLPERSSIPALVRIRCECHLLGEAFPDCPDGSAPAKAGLVAVWSAHRCPGPRTRKAGLSA